MENLKKQNLTNEEKMEILRVLQLIIWDANRLIGKIANSDSGNFDYNEFKDDFSRSCKFMSNDIHDLMKIKLE